MGGNGNPIRRFFSGITRPPLTGVEVQDSTWAEWESVLQEEEDASRTAGSRETGRAADQPEHKGRERPERR